MYVRRYPLRFISVFLFLIICLLFFAVRLILIQVFSSSHLANLASKQHNHFIELEPVRGTIYDRRHRPLALNVSVYSLYANPRDMSEEDKKQAVDQISVMLDLDPEYIRERLSRDKLFVWIKRKLKGDVADQVRALKIKGLDFIKESKRFYPNQELAAHIIGFAGIDNQGLEGLELAFNTQLKGESGWAQFLRDARQRDLLIEKSFVSPKNGFDLILTIDETIQYITERALRRGFEKYKAKSGTAIVVDVRTGEILALANLPTYNLEEFATSNIEDRTNRAISFVYEPGSVFKIVTAAAALEEGIFTETDKIFCENGEYRVANHILHDHKPHGMLSFAEVFKYSSNIGTAKIAQKISPQVVYRYGHRFRFGMKTDIDLKGEVRGIFKHPDQWSKVSITAIPMGHEVTTTPLQLVYAMAAVANDGLYMQPYVVKSVENQQGEKIKSFYPRVVDRAISSETSARLRKILTSVVESGTGRNAQIEGIAVAGKTGTAQKVIDGQYSHSKFYATFMGFAPADNPQLAAVVVFDEPRPSYFGGTTAAPVFKEIVENTLKYLEMSSLDQEN